MTEYITGTDGHEGHWFTGEKITRCRDCFYYEQSSDRLDSGRHTICLRTGVEMVEPFGFCAWGERIYER